MIPPNILIVDKAGQPIEWGDWQTATRLYAKSDVLWTLGGKVWNVKGGINRLSSRQSSISLHSIVAINALSKSTRWRDVPLTNKALFRRDGSLCMYCAKQFCDGELTRDHILPTSKGGQDTWMNVVAACRRCNNNKGDKLIEKSNMTLVALPYAPNHAEYLALINSRKILLDQMAFLQSQFSSNFRGFN